MKEENYTEIVRAIGRLEGKVEEGFASINQRLDKTNGTLKTHDEKIDKLESFKDNMEGREQETKRIANLWGAIGGSLISAVIWVASKIWKN